MRTKKERYLKRQEIRTKDSLRKRERRKIYLYLKYTGRYLLNKLIKEGRIKIIKNPPPVIPIKLSRWQRLKLLWKKIISKLKLKLFGTGKLVSEISMSNKPEMKKKV